MVEDKVVLFWWSTVWLMCCFRYNAESVLSTVLHVSLRLQDVRPRLPQRWRCRPWQPRLALLRRDAGRLRWTHRVAVSPESDSLSARSERHEETLGRRIQTGSHEFEFSETDEPDECGVGVSHVHRAHETGGGWQSLPRQRYALLQDHSRYFRSS